MSSYYKMFYWYLLKKSYKINPYSSPKWLHSYPCLSRIDWVGRLRQLVWLRWRDVSLPVPDLPMSTKGSSSASCQPNSGGIFSSEFPEVNLKDRTCPACRLEMTSGGFWHYFSVNVCVCWWCVCIGWNLQGLKPQSHFHSPLSRTHRTNWPFEILLPTGSCIMKVTPGATHSSEGQHFV